MKRLKVDFATILHLAELFNNQYEEKGLQLTPKQNEICFRDFVWQYYSALHWGKKPNPMIDIDLTF